jgi:hypothetical protein
MEWSELTMTLTKDQMRRLTRILNMMGSEHEGEILNAARAAQRLLGSLGATLWEEVLLNDAGARWTDADLEVSINAAYKDGHKRGYAAHEEDAKSEALKAFADADSCPAFARLCLSNYKDKLTEWEIGFCESWSVKDDDDVPTDKQIMVFRRLARKVKLTAPE